VLLLTGSDVFEDRIGPGFIECQVDVSGQLLLPVGLLEGVLHVGGGFGQQRRLLLTGELHEHVAGLDEVAVLEVNAADGVGDLGGQRDPLVGLRGADRLDPIADLPDDGGLDLDVSGAARETAAAAGGTGAAG